MWVIITIVALLLFVLVVPSVWYRLPPVLRILLLVLFAAGVAFVAFVLLKSIWSIGFVLLILAAILSALWGWDRYVAKKKGTDPRLPSPNKLLSHVKKIKSGGRGNK